MESRNDFLPISLVSADDSVARLEVESVVPSSLSTVSTDDGDCVGFGSVSASDVVVEGDVVGVATTVVGDVVGVVSVTVESPVGDAVGDTMTVVLVGDGVAGSAAETLGALVTGAGVVGVVTGVDTVGCIVIGDSVGFAVIGFLVGTFVGGDVVGDGVTLFVGDGVTIGLDVGALVTCCELSI